MSYKIMHVGCGSMGNTWMEYALRQRTDCEIIGLTDIVPSHAEDYKNRYKLNCPIYENIDKALQAVKPDIIFDTTTPDAHREIRTKGLRAGCIVLGEKPLADSYEGGLDIVKTGKETGKRHAVMQNRRYLPSMRKMQEITASGMLGRPSLLTSRFFIGAHFGGFRDEMDNPLILDMAVHTFDQARLILGSDPVSVYCKEFNTFGSWYKGNASAICIFEFENGAVYNYCGSWSAEGLNTSWEADWHLICEKGSVKCDGNSEPVYDIVVDQNGFISETERVKTGFNYSKNTGHFGCLDEMFSAIEAQRPAETDCADNIKTLSMVFGAIDSAKTGKKILL